MHACALASGVFESRKLERTGEGGMDKGIMAVVETMGPVVGSRERGSGDDDDEVLRVSVLGGGREWAERGLVDIESVRRSGLDEIKKREWGERNVRGSTYMSFAGGSASRVRDSLVRTKAIR